MRIATVLLVLYGAIVAVITLAPVTVERTYSIPIDRIINWLHERGLPEWFNYGEIEFMANVAMFVPLGAIIALALPHRWQWFAALIGVGASAFIESAQLAFLPGRFATMNDVIANSSGAFIGVCLLAALRAFVHLRDRYIVAEAFAKVAQTG